MFPIPLSPKLILAGIAATAILATAGGLYIKGRHDAAEKAKAAVAASQQAQRQAEVTTQALDTYHTQTIVIRERADRAVSQVQQAPGATDAIDPDRRAILCAALASVRDAPVCEDATDPGKPEGDMQRADNPDAKASR